jgi:hypothetical protein
MKQLVTSKWTKIAWRLRSCAYQLYQRLDTYYVNCLQKDCERQNQENANDQKQEEKRSESNS